MGIIVGIDIGGSTTKIVGMSDGERLAPLKVKAGDPVTSAYGAFGRFLNENHLSIKDVDKVMCTGVGSTFIKQDIYGIRTETVDEFRAIGLGGKHLSQSDNAIIVSMGTGTAIVSVGTEGITHMGGTGVGGGTILGLSRKMLGMHSFEHVVELARGGVLSNIDLSIGDITDKPLSNFAAETTASNFGKVSDVASPADVALGILNLVFQTIGMFAVFAARAKGLNTIVLTGNLSIIGFTRKVFDDLETLTGCRFLIPTHSDFATALGAAIFGGGA